MSNNKPEFKHRNFKNSAINCQNLNLDSNLYNSRTNS